jgi:hypothetical protein
MGADHLVTGGDPFTGSVALCVMEREVVQSPEWTGCSLAVLGEVDSGFISVNNKALPVI